MPDRKKVIKGLYACTTFGENGTTDEDCKICPYNMGYATGECWVSMNRDALALLEEQEAKQVIKQTYHVMMNQDYENPIEVTRYDWLCPTCKSLLCRDVDVIDDNYHFCKVCGQTVKWE